jgi:hypothetical protein
MIKLFRNINYRNKAERLKKVLQTFLANETGRDMPLQNQRSNSPDSYQDLVIIAPENYQEIKNKN